MHNEILDRCRKMQGKACPHCMYVNGFVKKAGMLRIMHDRTRNKTSRKKVTPKGETDVDAEDGDLEKKPDSNKGKSQTEYFFNIKLIDNSAFCRTFY